MYALQTKGAVCCLAARLAQFCRHFRLAAHFLASFIYFICAFYFIIFNSHILFVYLWYYALYVLLYEDFSFRSLSWHTFTHTTKTSKETCEFRHFLRAHADSIKKVLPCKTVFSILCFTFDMGSSLGSIFSGFT